MNFLLPKIEQNRLSETYQLDCELVDVLTSMEYVGVTIDRDKLDLIENEIGAKLLQSASQINTFTDGQFNINSGQQLNKLLFDKLNLVAVTEKGKNGFFTVSSAVLSKMLPQHPIIELILDHRALHKVKSTFIKALKSVNPTTGSLHSSINQTVTETGRLSSSNPNLQNIPSRTIGKRLRECFIASSDNHSLIGADYSNIELRVVAIISKDEKMMSAYRDGIDLHKLTASKVLGIPYEDVNDSQRNMSKTINFGIMYGMTAQGLAQSLIQSTGKDFTVDQCQSFINNYFELYDGVAKCRDDLIYKATINGYAETLFGRKRPLRDINSNDLFKRERAKRLALNTPIQGTAADIIKMAMVNIDRRIKTERLQSAMILQVHDELHFDVPNTELKYMEKLVRHEMENVVHLPVALKIDLKIGKTWADVH